MDKWSNIYSWQDSEPPVDGDSVVVPEGQAIMLDVDSPKLFLLLISGYFEFDRKDDWIRVMVLHGLARFSFGGVNGGMYINRRIHHSGRIHRSPFSVVFDPEDLQLDSTYIWIAGGNFYVGSEAAPFLHQATITLHGDRWHTIELPVIGSKMLAVTDLGGLGGVSEDPKKSGRFRFSSRSFIVIVGHSHVTCLAGRECSAFSLLGLSSGTLFAGRYLCPSV